MPTQTPEVVINYTDIITYISKEIEHIWQELSSSKDVEITSLIANIKKIEVSDEQYFRKQEKNRTLRRGTVYLIVRFSAGSINYGSSVTPISIYGLGVANQVKPVQLLLGTFASYWTTKNLGEGLASQAENMLQVWNTPEVVSNFNVLDDDWRNLYRVTGNIVIGPHAVRLGTLTYYYKKIVNNQEVETSENISIMTFQDAYHASLDSQPFGNTNGFAQSEVNLSTYTFSISTYLLDNQLTRDVLAVRGFRYRPNGVYDTTQGKSSTFDANNKIKLELKFTNDFNNKPGNSESTSSQDPVKGSDFYMFYKLVDSQIGQELAGIPTLTLTFTR